MAMNFCNKKGRCRDVINVINLPVATGPASTKLA